jgi:hypothetical protein
MQRTPFLARLSQSYVRLGTLRGMADVAGKLAVARKALAEMRETEEMLLTSGATQEQMGRAMEDVAEQAGIAAEAAGGAIGILERMGPEIERFLAGAEREMAQRARGMEPEVEDVAG